MSNKNSNYNHKKKKLGCIPELLLKRYCKTSKLVKKNKKKRTQHEFYQRKSNKHQGNQGQYQTWI